MWNGVGRMIQDVFLYTVKHLFNSDEIVSVPLGRGNLPNFGPKPLVSPFGPHYDMHPELSRAGGPAIYYAAAVAGYVGFPVLLAGMNLAVIESAPEHEQRGLYQMFSSALTGTFGGDYSTLI